MISPPLLRPLAPIATIVAAAAITVMTAIVGVPPASAAVCPDTNGVTVVVQFPGGRIETGCAKGRPRTGLDALYAADFRYEFVPRQEGAVCRINGAPAGACWKPPNDWWSYWHATPGGQWVLSNRGAGNRAPHPGGAEGWVFGPQAAPAMAVPNPAPPKSPARKPTPKPKPAPKPKPSPKPEGPAPTAAQPDPDQTTQAAPDVGADTASPERATPKKRSKKGGTTAGSMQSDTPAPATDDDAADTDAFESGSDATAAAPRAAEASDPSTLSWRWGVAALIVLIGGGVVAVLRRRAG